MLEVCDLTVNYRRTQAISGITFELQPGQITGLLGPNGAGKSTLVKAILGLVPTTQGFVKFGSRPLKKQLKRVAYVPQRSQIDWDYPVTVQKVVMMGRIAHTGWFRKPSVASKSIVREALERVGMWQYRQHQISELSGGQQQRIFLARAIAQEADLFFFDEPFNNIDRQTEAVMFDLFSELKVRQKTLLVISHDLGETLSNYDRLLLLDRQLIASGKREEVLTRENLKKAYGFSMNKQQLAIEAY
ncbi:metal ABC transporter ATP-binding protein [Myxosarcina sp. GI1]|uniref:metal ABC transporter ATP-binding protein n=1 Tax=Myxosarcina sp. GI1 TaxID=1541065 RepID=UPI00055BA3B1